MCSVKVTCGFALQWRESKNTTQAAEKRAVKKSSGDGALLRSRSQQDAGDMCEGTVSVPAERWEGLGAVWPDGAERGG